MSGAVPSSEISHCGNCDSIVPEGSHFCPECNAPITMAVIEPAGPVADPVEEVLPVVPVVPVVPPAPAYGHPVRWPWLVLTVTAGLCALTLLLFGCLGMFLAEEIAVEEMGSPFEYRLAALLCGLVPGLFLVAAALFGVFRAFRRRGR